MREAEAWNANARAMSIVVSTVIDAMLKEGYGYA
jgi:hypothetical protein